MTERLTSFLNELAQSGGQRWYPPTAASENEQATFQSEVNDLRRLDRSGDINIINEQKESRSGNRYVVQMLIEMVDGEEWLAAQG